MKTVYKYPMNTYDTLVPPIGKVVHFGNDPKDTLCVWIEVDLASQHRVARQYLETFGTGHKIPDEAEHQASCVDGNFVWHLYRVRP